MRGRSLRLDPADPDKTASNWDIVCVAPELERGVADYRRFVRRHAHLLAPCEDGSIESGVSHVHPELSPYAPPPAEDFAELNASTLARAADREARAGAGGSASPTAPSSCPRCSCARGDRRRRCPRGSTSAACSRRRGPAGGCCRAPAAACSPPCCRSSGPRAPSRTRCATSASWARRRTRSLDWQPRAGGYVRCLLPAGDERENAALRRRARGRRVARRRAPLRRLAAARRRPLAPLRHRMAPRPRRPRPQPRARRRVPRRVHALARPRRAALHADAPRPVARRSRRRPAPPRRSRRSAAGCGCERAPPRISRPVAAHRPLPENVSFPALEEEILERWRERDVFNESLRRREGAEPFVFYEGPPTANGRPGSHHVLARVFKDIFPRYQTMRGRYVERKGGWDCHGLPVEIAVEQQLGFTSKADIERYGIAEFNAEVPRVGVRVPRRLDAADRADRLLGRPRAPLPHARRLLHRVGLVGARASCGSRTCSTRATRSCPTARATAPRSPRTRSRRATRTSRTRRSTCVRGQPSRPARCATATCC